ncbi:hypothetical protein [uncultured Mediterranean phage uvDeep-CGR2-KM19-C37]|nr:hypothetical protein [uncultured Mediterranean phage uvDeep-CGR2-KM19-C37]
MAAPTLYYVDPDDGDDSTGNGLSDATAWKTIQKALDTITRDSTDGDQINIKAGTDDVLGAVLDVIDYDDASGVPAPAAPLIFRGYTAVANDGGIGGIDAGGATSVWSSTTIDGVHFVDMHLHNSTSSTMLTLDNFCMVSNCDIETGGTGHGIVTGGFGTIHNCYIHDCGGRGVQFSGQNGKVVHCFFRNSTRKFSQAIQIGTSGGYIAGNVMNLDSTSDGIEFGYGVAVMNNSVYLSSGTGVAINATSAGGYSNVVVNNLAEINHADADGIMDRTGTGSSFGIYGYNAVYAPLGTAYTVAGGIVDDRGNNVTLTASPFINAAGGDFRVKPATAGDGLKGAGWPSAAARKGLESYPHAIDLGALQRVEAMGQSQTRMSGANRRTRT